MHLGVEVTESSTKKQHHLSIYCEMVSIQICVSIVSKQICLSLVSKEVCSYIYFYIFVYPRCVLMRCWYGEILVVRSEAQAKKNSLVYAFVCSLCGCRLKTGGGKEYITKCISFAKE